MVLAVVSPMAARRERQANSVLCPLRHSPRAAPWLGLVPRSRSGQEMDVTARMTANSQGGRMSEIYGRLISGDADQPLRQAIFALLDRANTAGRFCLPTNEEAATLILDALEARMTHNAEGE